MSANSSQSMVATRYSKFARLHHGQPRTATAEFAHTEMRGTGISAATTNLAMLGFDPNSALPGEEQCTLGRRLWHKSALRR
jgi:hypothetical protein